MSKVKVGFINLSVPSKIEKARLIITRITGNAVYPAPVPSVIDLTNATDAVEVAYTESRNRDKEKVAILRQRVAELDYLISQMAAYVQQASGGDELKILSSGFDVRKEPEPKSDTAGEVINVRLSDGTVNGKVRVDFDRAGNAVLYVVSVSESGDPENTEPKGFTSKTFKEIGDFKSGTRICVRVMALGRENPGSPSDPAFFVVR